MEIYFNFKESVTKKKLSYRDPYFTQTTGSFRPPNLSRTKFHSTQEKGYLFLELALWISLGLMICFYSLKSYQHMRGAYLAEIRYFEDKWNEYSK